MGRSRILRLDSFEQFAAINVLSDPGHIGGPVIVPNAIQTVLKWSLPGGRTANNVLYGVAPGVPNPTVAMADALFTALGSGAQWTAFAAEIATTVSFTAVTLRSVHVRDQPVLSSTGAAKAGTNASQALPNENAVCVTERTAKTGQQNRGRLFLVGFNAGTVAAGNIIAAPTVTAVQNWVNTFIAAFSAQGLTLSIGQPARAAYTGSTGTQHAARSATSTPITSMSVRDNKWDSQRRRGLK